VNETQLLPAQTPSPTRRHRVFLVVAACALVVVVAAALLVAKVRPKPRCGPELPDPDTTIYGGDVLGANEVLATVLARWSLPQPRIDSIYSALGKTDFQFRSMRPGDSLSFRCQGSTLTLVRYFKDLAGGYEVRWDSSRGLVAEKFAREVDTVRAALRGVIKGSLWNTLIEMGERPSLVVNYAEILSYDVDFLTEVNEGDSFEILLDKLYVDSLYFREGRIHAVHYKGQAGNYWGFYFRMPSGHWDYYTERGQSLRKTVLRSPLQFAKVTSHFGMRMHPIRRVYREHHGVDYGAPTGTPVSAIADGTVTLAGWNNGWGNYVRVRHAGGLVSGYGHLSRYGPGIKSGRSVRQGQTVGYVGSTGMSTGPHLHFEVKQGGKFVNPLKVIPPRAEPVPSRLMADFQRVRDGFLAALRPVSPAVDSAR
jgi:murein DD-endopeptidase MepM/ murein hydrolase activator NlpD